MSNWVIGSMKYLKPLYNLMKEDLLRMKLIHANETTTKVLNEEGKPSTSTSYMWYIVPISMKCRLYCIITILQDQETVQKNS